MTAGVHARSALFTLFGDVVRPAGGEAWLSTLTGCMQALGFSPEATRTALHRMAAEGWVEPRRVGRYAAYRLTPRGVDRLEEAAMRIYRLRAVDWDHRWRLLVGEALRGRSELARALRWMGFGRLTAETWVSPHDHGERLETLLAEHGRPPLLRFTTDPADGDGARNAEIVATAWDLRGLWEEHAEFLRRWQPTHPPAEPEAAFRTRIALVHEWRRFLHLDPGLPAPLLPGDWLGDEAAACFHRLYEAAGEPAEAFYRELASTAPGGRLAPAPPGQDDPFARGLAALHRRGGKPDEPNSVCA